MAGFDLNSLLNSKSKGAAVQTEEKDQGSGFDIVMIDVEDLMPSKDNFYSTENIDELAVSIELSGGVEQNLVVKPEAHGKYEVIAGHRRRLAVLKLVSEGKEEYRKVPCRIKKESDAIKDRLSLILTNSTARQLTDWEKIKQAEEIKAILTEYKEALREENKGKPKEERERMGRIREIVAQMLNTSTTQIGRMEAINNNLSQDFKEQLEKGNINISTAHELSRLDEQEQKEAYKQYEEKGELHIKDVKQEEKEEITDEQAEQAQEAIKDAIKGEANRAIFKARDNVANIERALRKYFSKNFQGRKLEGKGFIYRFQSEGMTIIDANTWENFLIEYTDLADIVALMIENGSLVYDDTPEEVQEEQTEESTADTFVGMNEPEAAVPEEQEEDGGELPGQYDMTDYPESLPTVEEKGLDFTEWIRERYGTGQYELIGKEIRRVITAELEQNKDKPLCPAEWEARLTNSISVWVMNKTTEYRAYLQG